MGFPLTRACVVLSLATACVCDAALGPYEGKETGETALLRSLLDRFDENDVVVFDRYYCSFMMLALLRRQGAHVCTRQHQLRSTDFRRGRRLGPGDPLVASRCPQRPTWMSSEQYEQVPETMTLRELRFDVTVPGRRGETLTVVTTLTDSEMYSKEEIAELYGFRWNAELDIRQIKQTLHLDHVRCKTPERVRRELWVTLLAYNLIRKVIATSAAVHQKQPRHLGFTFACQTILASWMLLSTQACRDARALYDTILAYIAANEVAPKATPRGTAKNINPCHRMGCRRQCHSYLTPLVLHECPLPIGSAHRTMSLRSRETRPQEMRRSLDSVLDVIVCLEGRKNMRLFAAILVFVGLSLPCQALTVKELADLFEAQESAIVDVVVEYEWRNERQQPAEVIQESDDDLLTVERETCVFATARPFGDRQLYFSRGDVTTKQGETFSLEVKRAYNGDVFKELSIGGTSPRAPQGIITDRTDRLREWTLTPMAFTILRNRKEGMLSEIRDHPEAVRLVEGTKRVREFNTIELDFVTAQGTVHRKYFFSVDHGYTPVRYEWIGVASGKTDAEVDVLALKEVSPGLWFPMKGTSRHVKDDAKAVYEAKTVKVNQNLSKDYFDLEFPADADIDDEIGYLQNAASKGSSSRLVILAIVPILAVIGIVLYRKLA